MEGSPVETAGQIRSLDGQLVILDIDLAAFLGVAPEHLNALVDERRPGVEREFAIPVGSKELRDLVPGIDDAEIHGLRKAQRAYTEHGVIIVCAVMDDTLAIQKSLDLVKVFVARRESLESSRRARPKPELH